MEPNPDTNPEEKDEAAADKVGHLLSMSVPCARVCILSSVTGSGSPSTWGYVLGLMFPSHSSNSTILFMALSHSIHSKSVCRVHN